MVDNLIAAEQRRPEPRPDDEVVRDYFDAADDDILADPYVQCDWLRESRIPGRRRVLPDP